MNIYSGSKEANGLAAALTNPTELAYRKGTLQHHYPLVFRGKRYADAEAAYQALKSGLTQRQRELLMTEILVEKFKQYPRLFKAVTKRGGMKFLAACEHRTGKRSSVWEGRGRQSRFLKCLIDAYGILQTELCAR
jgi:hypothetical protein